MEHLKESASSLVEAANASQVDVIARCLCFAASAVSNLMAPSNASVDDGASASPTIAPGFFHTPTAPVWRHALRVSIGVLASYSIGIWFDVTLSYWGTISTLVVMQPMLGNTWYRVAERAAGSFAGGLVATVLLILEPSQFLMAVMVVPLAVLVISVRTVNYAIFMVALTPMFMLLSDLIKPTDDLLLLRFVNETLGAFLGLAAGFLIFPTSDTPKITTDVEAAVVANIAFAVAASRHDTEDANELARAQREAGVASSRVEMAAERVRMEGNDQAHTEALRDVVAALRAVCGAAAVTEILNPQPPDANESRVNLYNRVAASLQMQLRTGTIDDSVLSDFEPNDLLGRAVVDLKGAIDAFIRVRRANRTSC
ncbi:FUSC family protein [Rhizobium leguminosarum]|nr:FUSC family protein [Rhizobium leguminosarum]